MQNCSRHYTRIILMCRGLINRIRRLFQMITWLRWFFFVSLTVEGFNFSLFPFLVNIRRCFLVGKYIDQLTSYTINILIDICLYFLFLVQIWKLLFSIYPPIWVAVATCAFLIWSKWRKISIIPPEKPETYLIILYLKLFMVSLVFRWALFKIVRLDVMEVKVVRILPWVFSSVRSKSRDESLILGSSLSIARV